jgi:hypothetical protein
VNIITLTCTVHLCSDIVFQIKQLHKLWMHALQKGLVEKDYCIALVQCICVIRLCFVISFIALAQCISVVRLCFIISCTELAQCNFVFQLKQLHKLCRHALQKGLVGMDYCIALLL